MTYGNHSLYNGVPKFAHLFVSLQWGMNPRFEGQTRAQRQGDFTNNSNNLPYKNLITFDTRVDSWLYNVMPILQPIQQICVRIPTPNNSDPLQLFEIFIYGICIQIWANFFSRWLPAEELHQRIGKKHCDYHTSNWHLLRVVFIQRSPNFSRIICILKFTCGSRLFQHKHFLNYFLLLGCQWRFPNPTWMVVDVKYLEACLFCCQGS